MAKKKEQPQLETPETAVLPAETVADPEPTEPVVLASTAEVSEFSEPTGNDIPTEPFLSEEEEDEIPLEDWLKENQFPLFAIPLFHLVDENGLTYQLDHQGQGKYILRRVTWQE